jgi:hypothetical protein
MDWTCRFCGTANAAGAADCRSCGAACEAAAIAEAAADRAAAAPPKKARWKMLAAVAVVAAILGGATSYLGSQRGGETVTVAGFEWERTVEIEDHETVREESWLDEVPEGATIVGRRRQLHHTEKEPAGTRKGQPVYRERPVYKQRAAYDVERWSVVRTLKAAGKDRSPRWPDIRLNLGEREGKRTETYVVVLQGRGLYRMAVPRDQWQEMHAGQIGTAAVDERGTVRDLR